ncbi:MAG: FMN-binding glutamate synthase family protein [Crenarchaeota archaeon]|nr:FMN-binding glutamate synthase family protein [Thermoproteota archaeon]
MLVTPNVHYIKEYLKYVPKGPEEEFWCSERIEHIRRLATTGRPWKIFKRPIHRYRILDRIRFRGFEEEIIVEDVPESEYRDIDLSHIIKMREVPDFEDVEQKVRDAIILEAPIYFADMSFGALCGNPNIAFVDVAEKIGAISGLGEGGLHPVIAEKYRRFFVQWASARFGIDIEVLNRGMGVTIKIGQGAKPGIGGHLPGSKVTEIISKVRRIPPGVDALSPAPHHDIYSIEDLGQRIWALKEATGKPVFVKVAATNYVPYVVSGIARMGADGAIVDSHGAGTGATPIVVRDHVGIPIELAIAAADAVLRREGLREDFTLIASGRISSADDAAKLIALGADMVSIGTAGLIAMGCIMCHTCNLGKCPAGLASSLSDGSRVIDLEFAIERLYNFMKGFLAELKIILKMLGLKRLRDLVGRRDLLVGYNIDDELNKILMLGEVKSSEPLPYRYDEGDLEFRRSKYVLYYSKLVETGDIVVIGAGSDAPPEVEKPRKILDWLRIDGAQVTRPSIDPYREYVDLEFTVLGGRIVSMPLVIRVPVEHSEHARTYMKIARMLNIIVDLSQVEINIPTTRDCIVKYPNDGVLVLCENCEQCLEVRKRKSIPILHLSPTLEAVEKIDKETVKVVEGFLIDSELDKRADPEIALVQLDKKLRKLGVRYHKTIIVNYHKIRDSGDITKLVALGADLVEVCSIIRYAIPQVEDEEKLMEKLCKLLIGLKREIALLCGAAGVYNVQSSLVGNRELLRVLDLDPRVRKLIDVKLAGSW